MGTKLQPNSTVQKYALHIVWHLFEIGRLLHFTHIFVKLSLLMF